MWTRRLHRNESNLFEKLLLTLPPEQRRLRFCGTAPDELIQRYVANIDWSRTTVFGAFSRRGNLMGALELVRSQTSMELAVQVLPRYQNRGIARKLLKRAILYAKTKDIGQLTLTCLGENRPMTRLARRFGMTLKAEHGEVASTLNLDPIRPSDFIQIGLHDNLASWAELRAHWERALDSCQRRLLGAPSTDA